MKNKKVKYQRDDGSCAIGVVIQEGTSFCLVQGTQIGDQFLEWLPKQSRRAWLVLL